MSKKYVSKRELILRSERGKIRKPHREYLNWIDGVIIHHEWKNKNSSEFKSVTITEDTIHRYMIHPGYFTKEIISAKQGKNIGAKYLLKGLIPKKKK